MSGSFVQDGSACLVSHCIGLSSVPVHMHERQVCLAITQRDMNCCFALHLQKG